MESDPEFYPPFTAESAKRMLAFLPVLERGEFHDAAEHYRKTGRNLPLVDELSSEVYKSGFVLPFDWSHWEEGRRLELAELAAADLITLRKLMTAFVRNDRFYGGAFAEKLTNGWVWHVLQRLEVLMR